VNFITVCVIPARYGSTRFPGKALADLNGKPIIRHVVERARCVAGFDRILVATDDDRIRKVVVGFGCEAVMTSSDLHSGTDRVAAALRGISADVVINLQGDEPMIDPSSVDRLVSLFHEDPTVEMGSLMCPIGDNETFEKPSVVKVVVDSHSNALYFSRAPIPYPRDGEFPDAYQHIGIYGFRRGMLEKFVSWPRGRLEETEKLEQLRALEHGVRIRMIEVPHVGVGIDTPEDLERVRRLLST